MRARSTRRTLRVLAALVPLGAALACGYYGKPVRSESAAGESYVPLPEPDSFRAPEPAAKTRPEQETRGDGA